VRTQLSELPVPRATLGEGPCWDASTASLYWTDIPAHLVHCLASDGRHTAWQTDQPVGAIAPRSLGGLLLAARDGFMALDPGTGVVSILAQVEPHLPGNRMNDGACDSAGRFFAGTMAEDETPGAGALYRLDPDHQVTQLFAGASISNGIGWSPDDRRMFYVDSHTHRVDVFDYEPATGAISNRRLFANVGDCEVMPDGLTVDAEGFVWVALWGGGTLHRYSPAGELALTIEVPAVNVTSCAFGGVDLDVLYITTAADPGGSGGALFACDVGVTGLPANPYRG
jgi:sugar lactone lactonase YvrE